MNTVGTRGCQSYTAGLIELSEDYYGDRGGQSKARLLPIAEDTKLLIQFRT